MCFYIFKIENECKMVILLELHVSFFIDHYIMLLYTIFYHILLLCYDKQ